MAMSSLIPGVLFKTTGVNQNHTPTDITTKPNELKEYYRRSSFSSDSDWPPESPVARKYDVNNTSSRLIMLNNNRLKNSHLRAKGAVSSDRKTSPERHFQKSNRCKTARHDKCYDSSSPSFPTPSPLTASLYSRSSNYDVVRLTRRNRSRDSSTTREVNRILNEQDESINDQGRKRRKYKKKPLQPPPMFTRDKHWLQHPDMTKGQMRYMHNIASVYDITDMKKLKQAQYIQLIYREQQRAADFFTPENYQKYINYMKSHRMLPFHIVQTGSQVERASPSPRPSREQKKSPRSQSAPRPPRFRDQQLKENRSPDTRDKTQSEKGKSVENDDTEYIAYPSKHPNKSPVKPEEPKTPRVKSARTTRPKPSSPSESEATTVTPRQDTPSPKSPEKSQEPKPSEFHTLHQPTQFNQHAKTRRESTDSLNSIPIVKNEVVVVEEPENTRHKEKKTPHAQAAHETRETSESSSENEEGTVTKTKRSRSRVKSASSRSSSTRSSSRMDLVSDHGDHTYRVESPFEEDRSVTKSPAPAKGYWEQPAPPVRESEPFGEGLVMTQDSGLTREGEQIAH